MNAMFVFLKPIINYEYNQTSDVTEVDHLTDIF